MRPAPLLWGGPFFFLPPPPPQHATPPPSPPRHYLSTGGLGHDRRPQGPRRLAVAHLCRTSHSLESVNITLALADFLFAFQHPRPDSPFFVSRLSRPSSRRTRCRHSVLCPLPSRDVSDG